MLSLENAAVFKNLESYKQDDTNLPRLYLL